jgi:hypothetical protein
MKEEVVEEFLQRPAATAQAAKVALLWASRGLRGKGGEKGLPPAQHHPCRRVHQHFGSKVS